MDQLVPISSLAKSGKFFRTPTHRIIEMEMTIVSRIVILHNV